MYKLAHVSDWHATTLVGARPLDLLNKRFLGWLSWWQKRRHRHRPEILRALFSDLEAVAPDHVAVTGDLTNIALEQEFREAAGHLAELGDPSWVSLVPGNHDAYVVVPGPRAWDHWAEYLASDATCEASETGAHPLAAPTMAEFPTLRVRGPVALVGVCTAVPTPPGMASGKVGPPQLDRLRRLLLELGRGELCRVLLVHHAVTDEGFTRRRRLSDSAALRGVLKEAGAELVLHGHGHRTLVTEVEGPAGGIPVVGVRSSSHSAEPPARRAQYHVFSIEREPKADGRRFRLRLATRGYDATTGGFAAEGEREL